MEEANEELKTELDKYRMVSGDLENSLLKMTLKLKVYLIKKH